MASWKEVVMAVTCVFIVCSLIFGCVMVGLKIATDNNAKGREQYDKCIASGKSWLYDDCIPLQTNSQ